MLLAQVHLAIDICICTLLLIMYTSSSQYRKWTFSSAEDLLKKRLCANRKHVEKFGEQVEVVNAVMEMIKQTKYLRLCWCLVGNLVYW